jgi:hypothetical protein
VNHLNTVTDALTLPARTAGHVAAATLGATVGAATVGLRATGRAFGWALDRAGGGPPHPAASPWPAETTSVVALEPTAAEPVAERAPVTRSTPKRASARKAPARRTPSAKLPATGKAPARKKAPNEKAAVLAPALGVPEADVLDGTADLDPA